MRYNDERGSLGQGGAMNPNASNWQSQFSQGFAGGMDPSGFYLGLFILALLATIFILVYRGFQKRRTQNQILSHRKSRPDSTLNLVQQTVLHEIIDEFRRREPAAQAVPAAVLEKFAEFFYVRKSRLKVSRQNNQAFLGTHYPLHTGDSVEVDLIEAKGVSLVSSVVTGITRKGITVLVPEPLATTLTKGQALLVNYASGTHFLQGLTSVLEVQPAGEVLLSPLERLHLTRERRWPRIPVQTIAGSLTETRSGTRRPVRVLDISHDGARVRVSSPLEKKAVHQLTFEAEAGGKRWIFGPLECVSTQVFATEPGGIEYGMVFLYVDTESSRKLSSFLKASVQPWEKPTS